MDRRGAGSTDDDYTRLRTVRDLQREVKARRQRIQSASASLAADEKALSTKQGALDALRGRLRDVTGRQAALLEALAKEVLLHQPAAGTGAGDDDDPEGGSPAGQQPPRRPGPSLLSPAESPLPAYRPIRFRAARRRVSFTAGEAAPRTTNNSQLHALVKKEESALMDQLRELRVECEHMANRVTLAHSEMQLLPEFAVSGTVRTTSSVGGGFRSLSEHVTRKEERREAAQEQQLIREVRYEIERFTKTLQDLEAGERERAGSQDRQQPQQQQQQQQPQQEARSVTWNANEAAEKRRLFQLQKTLAQSTRDLAASEKRLHELTLKRERQSRIVAALEDRLRTLQRRTTASRQLIDALREHKLSVA